MTEQMIYHTTDDNHTIAIHCWPASEENARGVLVWLHGMAEHGARYAPLADYLNAQGWHLYCPDHRGHGGSINEHSPKGHFADADGWQKVLSDAATVVALAQQRHPQLPCVLGGHSMGSFVALATAQQLGTQLAGLALCASDYHPGFYYQLMLLPIRISRLRNGKRGTSKLIRKLTFESWAKQIREPATEFDWLSAEAEQVQHYINDPLCGFDCSTETWYQLVQGLRQIHSVEQMAQLPEELNILLLAGEQDPMSHQGKGMQALEGMLLAMEQPVSAQYWNEGRHELLNDCCREEVHQTLDNWLASL